MMDVCHSVRLKRHIFLQSKIFFDPFNQKIIRIRSFSSRIVWVYTDTAANLRHFVIFYIDTFLTEFKHFMSGKILTHGVFSLSFVHVGSQMIFYF